ncbi:MAG: hypothetical protein K9J21_03965 [Bacteroidales bacterium]|nr:hypothetical protein [Bacteroidales bacterium]
MSKIRLSILVTALILAGVLTLIFIPKTNEPIKVNPEFRSYVNAFTSGIIPKDAPIRVQLQTKQADSGMIGKPVNKSLFHFSPEIKGKAFWIDAYTVEFRPKEYLEADQIYNAEFYLSELTDVPKDFSTMEFSFRTTAQSMEVKINNLKFLPGKQVKWLTLSGKILTADVEDVKNVRKILTAEQDSKELDISWTSTESSKVFNFKIDSIQRKKLPEELKLTWDGDEINAEEKGIKSIDITPLGDFILRNLKVTQQPEQKIILEFSDPLDPGQDLRGLIEITGKETQTVIDQNIVTIYPDQRLYGSKTLFISNGLNNIKGKTLSESIRKDLRFKNVEPDIKLRGKGVIMPSSNGLMFPFESVNLRAVDITIYQIYENNILQFLQENDLDEYSNLSRVAKIAYKGTVSLNSTENPVTDFSSWNNFAIDLEKFIKPAQGALYRVQLNIRKEYSTYPCQGQEQDNMKPIQTQETEIDEEEQADYDDWSYHRLYRAYGNYPSDYSWRERDNPCHSSYFYRKSYTKNILASDLGIIAKRGKNNKTTVFVTDIVSAEPLSGIKLNVYDYQQQLIHSSKTNSDGKATFRSQKKPFVIIAQNNDERGYLKMNDGLSNSLSKFDVSGAGLQKGLNGFIYGERDVWRPGDTLFISFILEDQLNKLPDNVPVICEFHTPQGQLYERIVNNNPLNKVYDFQLKTEQEDKTGMWRIRIKVGHATFTKYARIETIKPNRLDIDLTFDNDHIKRWDVKPGKLNVEWLHGGTASNLKTKTEVTLRPVKADFKQFKDYTFQDPSKSFHSETYTVFEGQIDKEGNALIIPDFNLQNSAPGLLNAHFETRVFEKGGNSNINKKNFTYYPYRSYAGIKSPGGDSWYNPLETGEENILKLCNVDADGKAVNNNSLKIDIYKLSHSWWYDYSGNKLERLLNDNSTEPYISGRAKIINGKAKFNFRVNKPDHGRYFIRVTDMNSGHSAGELVYISGRRWWQKDKNKDFASLLIFNSDKKDYETGDKVKLRIPSSKGSQMLVSLENGLRVLNTEWVEAKEGETVYTFTATKEMAPAIYAHVTLLQPHSQTENDLPLRLYGVIPIKIEEAETHLEPQIISSETFRPESKASIKIKEKNNRPMTYTLAVVDEGLLNLTNYQTPDPWKHFYQRKALGVKTWDLYDYVIGAFGGNMNRILSVGGGGYAEIDKDQGEVNRFKPMVRYLGPFELKKGETANLQIDIPQYIGSVRIMAVARENNAYGHKEKTVKVKSPLMVMATMPRVLSPGEEIDVPVNVFAMEDNVKDVDVSIKHSDIFELKDNNRQNLKFSKTGDKLATFKLKVKEAIGTGKIEVSARSGNHTANYTIDINIENPNPLITNTISKVVHANNSINIKYEPMGMKGTNKAILEISSIPPIDLSKRLEYLIRYPYGCIEQTVSSAFPQLYLANFTDVSTQESQDIARNIKATINSIKRMQHSNGGFGYWPGSSSASLWGTNYAGHFLTEAQRKGYQIPETTLNRWYSYQKGKANSWSIRQEKNQRGDLIQAYRLYTLANYGKPAIGAMNRLKSKRKIDPATAWMLAAAYAKAGEKNTAKRILAKAPESIQPYEEYSYTYGSHIRDYAIIAEAYILTGQSGKAFTFIKEIAEQLSSDSWLSTQTIAFSLLSVSDYLKENKISEGIEYEITINGKQEKIKQLKPFQKTTINPDKPQNIEITNNSGTSLYSRLIKMGKPMKNPVESKQKNLNMTIKYQDLNGKSINPEQLTQGTDFIAEVTVKHNGKLRNYKEMALEQVFPSGWEITGMRLQDGNGRHMNSDSYDYQDVRDDRVYTFFDLNQHESKTFRVMLNASYLGTFYHPVNQCKAMYSDDIYAYKSGFLVQVIRP